MAGGVLVASHLVEAALMPCKTCGRIPRFSDRTDKVGDHKGPKDCIKALVRELEDAGVLE